MPSTRRQKAKGKRIRQSDVMSDIENMDVMLGTFHENSFMRREITREIEVDLESGKLQRDFDQVVDKYRSLLNNATSENSEITLETSREINSEIYSRMSRKLEEIRIGLYSNVLEE